MKVLRKSTSVLLAGTAIVTLSLAAQARAQDAAPTGQPAPQGADGTLAEVVVTAERVTTPVQKTPISMAVATGAELTAAGVTNLQNLGEIAPDFHLTTGQNGAATASIRGVSSSGAGAVTLDYDGQYIGTFNGGAYDLARVEVLKGPQGTLYGLNATAGTVNVVTNAPSTSRLAADGSVEYGNYNALRATGALNLPVNDTLAIRIAGLVDQNDGYRQINGGQRADYTDIDSLRASVLWKPIDRFKARVTSEVTTYNYGPNALQGVIVTGLPTTQPPYGFNSSNLNPTQWNEWNPGFHKASQWLIRADLEYDFGWATLTWLPNYAIGTDRRFENYFGTPVQSIDGQQNSTTITNQQEVRLSGDAPTMTKWQVGYFYLESQSPSYTNYFLSLTNAFVPPDTVQFLHFDQPDTVHENNAFYGQVTQAITDQLSLTAGARYTLVHQSNFGYDTYTLNVGPFLGSGGKNISYGYTQNPGGPYDYDKTTWHVGLDYQATPLNLIYVSVGTSFKDGGFTQLNTYLPEDITAYEIGSKNRFFDNKVEVNAAAFYYQYRNEQVTAFQVFTGGVTAVTTLNAGASDLKGAELDVNYAPLSTDRLGAHLDYTDARFLSFNAAEAEPGGGNVNRNLAGNRPPTAPQWVVSGNWEHHWKIGEAEIVSTVTERYSSDYYLDIYNLPAGHVAPWNKTDINVAYREPKGRWELALWVRNLEDRNVLNYSQFLNQGSSFYLFGWEPPRTYGVRFSAHY